MDISFWILLGILQGFLEWIPVSSEAFLFILAILYGVDITQALVIAILMHFATSIAAIIYYRYDYWNVLRFALRLERETVSRNLFSYFIIAGGLTLLLGVVIYYALLSLLKALKSIIELGSVIMMIIIGLLLIIVGLIMRSAKLRTHYKSIIDMNHSDSVILGIAQAFSVLPGVSRSGITISALLLKNYDQESSIKLSFIIAPIVIIPATIFELIMNYNSFINSIWGYLFISELIAFLTSLLAIKFMTSLAKKLDFSKFMITIGLIIMVLNIVYVSIL